MASVDRETPWPLPQALFDYLDSDKAEDIKTSYPLPPIITEDTPRKMPTRQRMRIESLKLPARLNNPLIPYTDLVKKFVESRGMTSALGMHDHHYTHLSVLLETLGSIPIPDLIRTARIEFSLDLLKKMVKGKYNTRDDLIHKSAAAFATRATQKELSVASKSEYPYYVPMPKKTAYNSFLVSINRLRVFIAQQVVGMQRPLDSELVIGENASFILYNNMCYRYHAKIDDAEFILLAAGNHFMLYHSDHGKWFCGTKNYLDYMYTIADILNNLACIAATPSYVWAKQFFEILEEMAASEANHNDMVNFMKSLEGFILMLSDYDEASAMNWAPILDVSHELWVLDKTICSVDYPYEAVLSMISGRIKTVKYKTFLIRMLETLKPLRRLQLQELSSLHKFIFYAEVDSMSGIRKFLRRVHNPRKMDKEAVKNIVRLAKREFFCSYVRKHKVAPNCKGNVQKGITLLDAARRKRMDTILSFELSWWDDVIIWNCMDNTLTADPLEFAKDKGALRSNIRYGPGDSQKELLQVISNENYMLKDFFGTKRLAPLPQRIIQTHSRQGFFPMNDPVRLIEKEKEQKIEARLFANGELSNKHALSVVATRMKKALSYYDEQLMTPTDKKRKELIHDMAQSILKKDSYSMLLDIEGHNQSMQHSNTSELCEFIGNLYGEEGWGDLPHYFSMLHVYHYDEYEDKVIVSEGQLGGIEGWLNPLWTMHTTLMMKLLRIMEDVDLVNLLVYSDDVDGIVNIPQATQATVQATFQKVVSHCAKFGMIVKIIQTNLSKHRVTMLRQHYADGMRSDSTLKRLISVSTANNAMLMSDELEVAGISSSSSSAMELTNNSETCCYLKNYKLGLLLSRLPHTILGRIRENSMLASDTLPQALSSLLYHQKYDTLMAPGVDIDAVKSKVFNDVAAYLHRPNQSMDRDTFYRTLTEVYSDTVAHFKLTDSADRILYLQMYDAFLMDLLFFWIYLPTSLGGLGGSMHINLLLSGHSSGMSKSLHYLKEWIVNYSSDPKYFLTYLTTVLRVDREHEPNFDEKRVMTSSWPSDRRITSAATTVSNKIRQFIIGATRNKSVLKLIDLADQREQLQLKMLCIFRDNFHPRIAQFYYENSSVHFLDLLLNKVETSSGLLQYVKRLDRMRNQLVGRSFQNLIRAAELKTWSFGDISERTDIVEYLLLRRAAMFPNLRWINIDEPLYDDKIEEVQGHPMIAVARQQKPTHYENGVEVYDRPDVGNEVMYKGEITDNDRMLGNKEELLAAKLCAVTKWMLTKAQILDPVTAYEQHLDIVMACDTSLSTLTGQTLETLWMYSPSEVGGEILHRIPNMRFNTSSVIRSELNLVLNYHVDLSQANIHAMGLEDSNVNFDYLRLRLKLIMALRSRRPDGGNIVTRWRLTRLNTIEDVQFITPKPTRCKMLVNLTSYGHLMSHTFSELRFRYIAAMYLTIDNTEELLLLPQFKDEREMRLVGQDYLDAMIYSYSLMLDREYMLHDVSNEDADVWTPLLNRLRRISPRTIPEEKDLIPAFLSEAISRHVSNSRSLLMRPDDTESSRRLQSSLIDKLLDERPYSEDYRELLTRSIMVRNRMQSHRLPASSKNDADRSLRRMVGTRREIQLTVCAEYVLRLHFYTKTEDGRVTMDIEKSLTSFMGTDMSQSAAGLVSKELETHIAVLTLEVMNNAKARMATPLRTLLADITTDMDILDVVLPPTVPSIEPVTTLTGDEDTPAYMREVDYALIEIGDRTMSELVEFRPLLEFATMCSRIGSHPVVFSSPTGSDSYSAQYGLFRSLLQRNFLNNTTAICDLTAGRGDMQYVARDLRLKVTSYGKLDTFTAVYYHPNVRRDIDYNVFRGDTIKFINQYQWVHVDISFTGKEVKDVGDLIKELELTLKGYSIRLNSVQASNYSVTDTGQPRSYRHFIAYAEPAYMKPYQIYLVGVPDIAIPMTLDPGARQSLAFRSLALGYARLLGPASYSWRSSSPQINSATISCRSNYAARNLFISIINQSESFHMGRLYKRYINESRLNEQIAYNPDMMAPIARNVLTEGMAAYKQAPTAYYTQMTANDIGHVSTRSRPRHEDHLLNLQDDQTELYIVKAIDLNTDQLTMLRRTHPLASVRAFVNVILGIRRTNSTVDLNDMTWIVDRIHAIESESPYIPTIRQQEYRMAVKLLYLAAASDDYTYGSHYCHLRSRANPAERRKMMATLRIYRLLSGHFEIMKDIIQTGGLQIDTLSVIRHELEEYESMFNYRILVDTTTGARPRPEVPEIRNEIIDFNKLIDQFQDWALNIYTPEDNRRLELESQVVINPDFAEIVQNELNFDVGIGDILEQFQEGQVPEEFMDDGDYDEGEAWW